MSDMDALAAIEVLRYVADPTTPTHATKAEIARATGVEYNRASRAVDRLSREELIDRDPYKVYRASAYSEFVLRLIDTAASESRGPSDE